jgi:hypothetical protein
MLILCVLWSLGLLTMWIQTSITMKQRGRTDVVGENKAILELAYAMNEQLEKPGEATMLALLEDALKSRVERDVGGGTISYGTKLLHNTDDRAWRDFRTLLRKRMWWILAILVAPDWLWAVVLDCVEGQNVISLRACWLLDLNCRCVVRWVV